MNSKQDETELTSTQDCGQIQWQLRVQRNRFVSTVVIRCGFLKEILACRQKTNLLLAANAVYSFQPVRSDAADKSQVLLNCPV